MKISNQQINIFYDPQIFYLQKFGGISKYFINLVSNIDQEKFLPKIIAPISTNYYLKEFDKKFKLNLINLKTHPRFTRKVSNFLNKNFFNFYCNLKKPKIIHSTYYQDIKYNDSKIVVTVYDLIHEIFKEKYDYKIRKMEKQKILTRADKIICISENTKKDLMNYYELDEKKISVTLLGKPETQNYQVIDNKILSEPFILFVGDRNKYKNFNLLVKAFASSKNLMSNFNLICFGSLNFTKDELFFFKEQKISSNKIKHISGSDAELNYLYKKASLYVCPSKYEGFGLTILEAMNMDCPIIASNSSSISEIGGHHIEYFDPNSIEDMIFKIETLIFDEDKKKKMIKSFKNYLENFSWKKNALETQKIYKQLL